MKIGILKNYSTGELLRIIGVLIASIIPLIKLINSSFGSFPVNELVISVLIGSCLYIFGMFADVKKKYNEINANLDLRLGDIEKVLIESSYQTKILDKKELYEKMAFEVGRAKDSVYLTTLQTKDPREADEDYILTYQKLMQNITKDQNIVIRRVITVPNSSKLSWVDDLLNTHRGNKKLRIRYVDSENNYQPLNVQIIDKTQVFIINPRLHIGSEDLEYKSIWFKNKSIADIFLRYYNQIWKDCERNILLERGVVDKAYFAKKNLGLNRCYRVREINSNNIDIQFSPSGKLEPNAWANLQQKIKKEKDLTSIGETELIRRYDNKYSAIAIHEKEIISHSSIVSIFSKNDCERLLKHSLKKVVDFNLYEFQGGWTDEDYRGRRINGILKNDLINFHMNEKTAFVNCTRSLSSAKMHLNMDWKIVSWYKYPYVSALVGAKTDDKQNFVTRTGSLKAEGSEFYAGDDLTIDLISQYSNWNDFHLIIRNEEKIRTLNILIEESVDRDLKKWEQMIYQELFFNPESK